MSANQVRLGERSIALVVGNIDSVASRTVEDLLSEGFQVFMIGNDEQSLEEVKNRVNSKLLSYTVINRENIFDHSRTKQQMKFLKSLSSPTRKVDLIINYIDHKEGLDWLYYAYLKELINLTLTELEVVENAVMINMYGVTEYADYSSDYNPYKLTSVFKQSLWESPIEVTSVSYELNKVNPQYISNSIITLLEQEYLETGYALIRNLLFERTSAGLRTLITDLEVAI